MTISYATARSAPFLEWEDERRLIEGWQMQKDRSALETLLLSHVRIVFAWVFIVWLKVIDVDLRHFQLFKFHF